MSNKLHMANICFDCKNSVPDNNGHGCPWSRNFEPVPGWTAEPTKVGAGKYATDTYCITDCPLFDPEDDLRIGANANDHCVKVRCKETGVVFHSLRHAGQAVGRDGATIGDALRKGRDYAFGFHWEYVKEDA